MLYCAILKENSIIADYSDEIGDFTKMLKKIEKSDHHSLNFYVIPYLNYDYYFLHQLNYTFATITNSKQINDNVYKSLEDLSEKFFSLYKNEKDNLSLKTTTLIKNSIHEYNKNNSNKIDKFDAINNTIENIILDKQKQLEATLEKDALINKVKEKAGILSDTVFNIQFNI